MWELIKKYLNKYYNATQTTTSVIPEAKKETIIISDSSYEKQYNSNKIVIGAAYKKQNNLNTEKYPIYYKKETYNFDLKFESETNKLILLDLKFKMNQSGYPKIPSLFLNISEFNFYSNFDNLIYNSLIYNFSPIPHKIVILDLIFLEQNSKITPYVKFCLFSSHEKTGLNFVHLHENSFCSIHIMQADLFFNSGILTNQNWEVNTHTNLGFEHINYLLRVLKDKKDLIPYCINKFFNDIDEAITFKDDLIECEVISRDAYIVPFFSKQNINSNSEPIILYKIIDHCFINDLINPNIDHTAASFLDISDLFDYLKNLLNSEDIKAKEAIEVLKAKYINLKEGNDIDNNLSYKEILNSSSKHINKIDHKFNDVFKDDVTDIIPFTKE